MSAQPELPRIPLAQLQLSPLNARKTNTRIDDLAASIAAHGLLQNLTVLPAANDTYEVVAGGRRLAALRLLQSEGRLPPELESVPCKVLTDADVAHEASTAENTLREAMHPADQFEAFRQMIDAGKPIADVAAHFGVTEVFVRQRLKLANVNPQLLQVYREGGMTLEQLQALALTDNHELQRQVWFTAKYDSERQPYAIKERITQKEVPSDSALAKFVGVDAYVAAGGSVRQDLFSARGECWLQDRALLERLAMEKLEAVAEEYRQQGWGWVETHLHLDYAQRSEYPKHLLAQTLEVDPPLTADQAARIDAIQRRIDELERDGDPSLDDEAAVEEQARLEAEHEAIIEAAVEAAWASAPKAEMGVLVFLGHGGLEVERGRLKPGQKPGKPIPTQEAATTGTTAAAPTTKEAPQTMSAAILLALSAHRSEVARDRVMGDAHIALALVTDWLIAAALHDHAHANLVRMSPVSAREAQAIAPDIHAAVIARIKNAEKALREVPKRNRLVWLIQQPIDRLLGLFAIAVGTRFDGMTERAEGHPGVTALHAAIGFDMAEHWNPTCDRFLARIPAGMVVDAVREAKGADVAATLKGLKKDELVAQAAKLLAGTGWLPPTLRGPGYGERKTAKPAEGTAKKPAAKAAAAKKSTAKPVGKKPAAKPKAAKATASTKKATKEKRR